MFLRYAVCIHLPSCEDSAADSKVLRYAISRRKRNKLKIPHCNLNYVMQTSSQDERAEETDPRSPSSS